MELLEQILFIDIETVPGVADFAQLPNELQEHWGKKARLLKNIPDGIADPAQTFADKAGIFSEFAKVVCIGFASFHNHADGWKLRLKSIQNEDEKSLLNDFCEVVSRFADHYPDLRFCGHNIKEFDIPFLCRRMVINGIGLPHCMQLAGKKPWEVGHIDTMDLWKFGDHKHYTSLALLAAVLGIPSPKDDLDGSMVAAVYWQEKDLQRIAKYCLQDVLTSAKVYLRLKGINDLVMEPVFVND
jgi:hypothetical protein